MIPNRVKVLISQVLLSCDATLAQHLSTLSDKWVEWVVSRGLVDNITGQVLAVIFSHDIQIQVWLDRVIGS